MNRNAAGSAFRIAVPSPISSDEEKRLYHLQITLVNTKDSWRPDEWGKVKAALESYVAAARAETYKKAYAGGWTDAMETIFAFAERNVSP